MTVVPSLRRLIAGLLSALVLASGLTIVAQAAAAPQARAADLSAFRPGNIITDELFFDGGAMSESAVTSFIQSKGANCRSGKDGTPCLKDYAESTPTRPADARCSEYRGAAGETAARIITKIGTACGISPRVLLVMLQKEQSLVTNTGASLSASRYRSAMGMGCPDTAACDTRYYGFFNQVYGAARQFKNYAAAPTSYGYRMGVVNTVRYSPTASCGSSPVFLENQATAGLYNYTPYQPNRAALAAGYGSGDACSAYGNRNFWNYYSDWFGSTQSPGGAAIGEAVNQAGGVAGLGAVLTPVRCGMAADGCGQAFARASVYWSKSTGAQVVGGGIFAAYAALGYENGRLGYPATAEQVAPDGIGRLQRFQGGTMVWGPSTGAVVVTGGIASEWLRVKGVTGTLGYPVTAEEGTARGRVQEFTGGRIYWSAATGARAISGAFLDRFVELDEGAGVLGLPTSAERGMAGGRVQSFQGGDIVWSSATGAQPLWGAVRTRWSSLGGAKSSFGYPLSAEQAEAAGGRSQQYQGGAIWWSPRTGAFSVTPAVSTAWTASGGAGGPLGYPTGEPRKSANGASSTQSFQRGYVSATSTAGEVVAGAMAAIWVANGGQDGPFGRAVGPEADVAGPTGSGRSQAFLGGSILWSASTGAWPVWGALGAAWTQREGAAGPLGLPTSVEFAVPGGVAQRFQGGTLYWTPGGGTFPVAGGILASWTARGSSGGTLGMPTSDEVAVGPGVQGQTFAGGVLVWSGSTGSLFVPRATFDAWVESGGPTGELGALVRESRSTSSGGWRTTFTRGSLVQQANGTVTAGS